MNPHHLISVLTLVILFNVHISIASAQKRKAPPGRQVAVVIDERLSALRATPELQGKLLRRIARGRLLAIRRLKINRDGVGFYLVNVSSRTQGWIQREAVVSAYHPGADLRLLNFIEASRDFDRIVRARIFLDHFPRSKLRPRVLLILGDAAEHSSEKLSREAIRRLSDNMVAPEYSYFLNYSGLDRYNRQGVVFVFDLKTKRLHYNGSAWRELLRRYPTTPEAEQARARLGALSRTVR